MKNNKQINKLIIKGAREHNLQNISIEIPKDKLVVITGISGSGKSSLAFDTIYAEGQRRYVESLSAYARQFLGMMKKPDVDYIEGLSPAISIDQKTASHNPRSTVGTITEIYDYLRLLFARAGHPHCPECGRRVSSQSVQDIVDSILRFRGKILILAPVVKKRKGTYEELFQRLFSKGYVRVRVDEEVHNLEEDIKLERYKLHNIEVVIDRLIIDNDSRKDKELLKRLTDSVESALNLGEGEIIVNQLPGKSNKRTEKSDILYSENFSCPACDISFEEIEPHTFSFNSPYGACPSCDGLGTIKKVDPELIYNPNLSITEGGIFPWSRMADNMSSWTMSLVRAVAEKYKFSIRIPIREMKNEDLNKILYGSGNERFTVTHSGSNSGFEGTFQARFEGVIPNLERRYKQTDSEYIRREIEQYMRELPCSKCEGKKLRPEALAVTIRKKNVYDVTTFSIKEALKWISSLKKREQVDDDLSDQERLIAKQVLKEIITRLNFLVSVGLDYLTLYRTARTLSGGEAQRIRLASQIGTGLSGVLYVLDEPSIGLHQKDNQKLIDTLKNLRDIGNTVIVVEHDEATIRQSDHIIDIGPGAGVHGGKVIVEGQVSDIEKSKKSLTGNYLSGRRKITKELILKEAEKVAAKNGFHQVMNKRPFDKKLKNHPTIQPSGQLTIKNVSHHNLKGIDVTFPLSKFICITGVSGSGKSSLLNETVYPALAHEIYNSKLKPGKFESIEGLENLDKVVSIDQSPIGRTPRSNPATYTGVFTPIRELFSKTREAKARGYKPGRFSFNVKRGRCESCQGDGLIKIEMQFLPDVYVPCEVCKGERYNRETLQIDYKGKNIAEVLDMTVEQALEFFRNIPSIKNKLQTLNDVGLAYIKLGQSALTLSGGEAQRVKLATELSKRSTGSTIYILDEPTTGLHFFDIEKLLVVLHSLVAKGNTVMVIEHNLDVIKTADWIIDLGPEGGEKGGEIIAEGTPEDITKIERSYTGQWLKKVV
ncbi:excinuclease ABC subunit UvrA [Candidatus Dojkabacteria bacterium]|nr:excinuclease ABC subunit UvrA [Candidatus Dojkabacteria bacterium]